MNWNDDGSDNNRFQRYFEGQPYYLGLHYKHDIMDMNRERIRGEIEKIKRRNPSFDADNIEYIKIYGGRRNLETNEYKFILEKLIELGYDKLKGLSFEGNYFLDPFFLNTINKFVYLEHLNLRGNQLKKLPDSIGGLSNLQNLNLSVNELKKLPDSIGGLSNLQNLNLSVNELKKLPDSIGNLLNLQSLNLSNNKLTNLPDTMEQDLTGIIIEKSPDLTGEDESMEEEMSETTGGFKNFQILNLSNNKFKTLPNTICILKKLKKLNFSNNQLEFISDDIINLTELQELDVSHNKLDELPDNLTRINSLKNLKKLNISYNKLDQTSSDGASILEILSVFENLESLNMSHNPITEIDFDFTDEGFNQLKEVDMSHIEIRELPEGMFQYATNLEKLNLSNNRLRRLPQSICKLATLTELKLEGNEDLQFVCNPQTENQYLSQYLTSLEQERLRRLEEERLRRLEQERLYQEERNRRAQTQPPRQRTQAEIDAEARNNANRANAHEVHKIASQSNFKKLDRKLIKNHRDWFPIEEIDPTEENNPEKKRLNLIKKGIAFKSLLKETFTNIIENDLEGEEQTKATADLNSIFENRLNRVQFEVSKEYLTCCIHILYFLSHQPKEFKAYYLLLHLDAVITAYIDPDNPAGRLSCVNGIVERIVLVFYQTCLLMSDFTGVFTGTTEAETDALKKEYGEYNDSFEQNLSDLILNWIRTEWKEKHRNAESNPTLEKKRELLLAYLLDPARLPDPEDKTKAAYINEINEYIKHIEFFTDDEVMSYGGKRKTMKRKSKQRKTIKRKSKQRKTVKRKSKQRKTMKLKNINIRNN